jgi:hypothetical protein
MEGFLHQAKTEHIVCDFCKRHCAEEIAVHKMKILKVSPDFQDLVPVSHSLTQYQHQSACMTWGNGEDFELGDSSQINVATVVTY